MMPNINFKDYSQPTVPFTSDCVNGFTNFRANCQQNRFSSDLSECVNINANKKDNIKPLYLIVMLCSLTPHLFPTRRKRGSVKVA